MSVSWIAKDTKIGTHFPLRMELPNVVDQAQKNL